MLIRSIGHDPGEGWIVETESCSLFTRTGPEGPRCSVTLGWTAVSADCRTTGGQKNKDQFLRLRVDSSSVQDPQQPETGPGARPAHHGLHSDPKD